LYLYPQSISGLIEMVELVNEIRLDIFGDHVSIISTVRRVRPKEFRKPQHFVCPFCAGNEEMTPPATLVLVERDGSEEWLRDSDSERVKGWTVRVVPNKFPALTTSPPKPTSPSYTEAYGYHEVVIETPSHIGDVHELSNEQFSKALKAAFRRIGEMMSDPRIDTVIMIKNRGPQAGASILHAHSQIFALPVAPKRIEREVRVFESSSECPLCRYLARELGEGRRLVYRGKHFAAVAYEAPRIGFETWIVPIKHSRDPLSLSSEELRELALVLRAISYAIVRGRGFENFNWWFHIAPKSAREFHWHVEVAPVSSTWGGLEKGGDSFIVEYSPEEAASELRKWVGEFIDSEAR